MQEGLDVGVDGVQERCVVDKGEEADNREQALEDTFHVGARWALNTGARRRVIRVGFRITVCVHEL